MKKQKTDKNSSQQEINLEQRKWLEDKIIEYAMRMGIDHESSCEWFYDSRYENKMGKL